MYEGSFLAGPGLQALAGLGAAPLAEPLHERSQFDRLPAAAAAGRPPEELFDVVQMFVGTQEDERRLSTTLERRTDRVDKQVPVDVLFVLFQPNDDRPLEQPFYRRLAKMSVPHRIHQVQRRRERPRCGCDPVLVAIRQSVVESPLDHQRAGRYDCVGSETLGSSDSKKHDPQYVHRLDALVESDAIIESRDDVRVRAREKDEIHERADVQAEQIGCRRSEKV